MLTKICMVAAIALGCTLVAPGASFAAADNDKTATTQHKKAKKGHAADVHWNRVPKDVHVPESTSKKPKKTKKKGHADDVHDR